MRSLALVLSAMLVTACVEDADDPASLATDPAALAVDPATFTSNGSCVNLYTWNGIKAQIYYPSNGGSCATSLYSPLVLIMPGFGFDQTLYEDLGRHLARNRHIVVVVDTVAVSGVGHPDAADYADAAETAWSFVAGYVWPSWPRNAFIDPNNVGLIGHSRGGEAVRYLAEQLAADPLFEVRAVVGLAGTDHTNRYLGSGDAVAALYLHGSSDGDVAPHAGLHAYDRTGNEASHNDPGFNPNTLGKTFKLLTGGDHASYTEDLVGVLLDKPSQRAAAKGYVLAFLKAWLANDWTWYPDYVRGNAVPGGWLAAVHTQHADGFRKRVIDHFEDGNNATNALGGSVIKSAGVGWSSVNLGLDPQSGHATLAMQLDVTGNSSVTWNVPAGKRDASSFVALSLRLGQVDGVATNGVTVQIQNGLVWSAALPVTTYGAIAQPLSICATGADNTGTGCEFNAVKLEHLSTIRVPLADFGVHNDVRAVRLRFAGNAIGTDLVVDSLEFAEVGP